MLKDRGTLDFPNLNGFELALSLEHKLLLSSLFGIILWRTVRPALVPTNAVSKWRMAEWASLPVSATVASASLSLLFFTSCNPLCRRGWNPSFSPSIFDIEQYNFHLDGCSSISVSSVNYDLLRKMELIVIKSAWHMFWCWLKGSLRWMTQITTTEPPWFKCTW